MATTTLSPVISPSKDPPPPPPEYYQSKGFRQIEIQDITAAKQIIESQVSKNVLLVNGYLKKFEMYYSSIPLELHTMIQKYTLISMEAYIINDGLPANPMSILAHIKEANMTRNYLLSEALALYCINEIDDADYIKNDKSGHHLYLAMTYEEMKFVSKAEHHYRKGMELRHFYACGFAAFLKREQRYEEAIKCVDDWFKQSKMHVLSRSAPLSTVLNFYYAKARCYELMNRIPEAMDVYGEMIKCHENNKSAPIALSHQSSKNLLYLAVAYYKYGCDVECERLYKQFMQMCEPDRMRYYAGLLRLLWVLKKHETSEWYLKKAIEAKQDDAFIWYYYGIILRQNGEYDQAIKCFEQSLYMMSIYKQCEIPLIDEFEF